MSGPKKSYQEAWKFYPTAEECADAAAPVFRINRWRWTRLYRPPDREEILDTLIQLQSDISEFSPMISTGRLIYHRDYGYGYKRPK